jgi:hypothetical protein
MKFWLPLSSLLLLIQFFSSCNSNAPKSDSGAANLPAPAGGKTAAKPEVMLFMVIADDLLLRDQPTREGSKVITKFKKGELLTGTGVVSEENEEAVIHNIPMNEPYYQVVSTTSEQNKGWSYGGGLLRVYAGSKAGSPDPAKLTQLSMFLAQLDPKKVDNGKKAWDFVKSNYSDASGPMADAVYTMLSSSLQYIVAEGENADLTEKNNWTEEDQSAILDHKFNHDKYPVSKNLAENGFRLAAAEGMVFAEVDGQKLHDFFAGKATPGMKTYLDQELVEENNQAWEDGGIIIPIEQIADRAAFWEKFNNENPFFTLSEQTREAERWNRVVLISGDNNTPIYNESNGIDDNFKKAWSHVLEKYPGTELSKAVKQIWDLCAAEGWKYTDKVRAFQEEANSEAMDAE